MFIRLIHLVLQVRMDTVPGGGGGDFIPRVSKAMDMGPFLASSSEVSESVSTQYGSFSEKCSGSIQILTCIQKNLFQH